jgi:3',5'-cyclic AMP phosphodiesterase CpdA
VTLRIVVISDTHGLHERIAVPDGDVLVHAGDLTARGRREELEAFNDWLGHLPHRHKLIIAGNHDWVCAQKPRLTPQMLSNATYLCDTLVTID